MDATSGLGHGSVARRQVQPHFRRGVVRVVDGKEKVVRNPCIVHADRASTSLLRRVPKAPYVHAKPHTAGPRARSVGEQLDIFTELERACMDRARAAVGEGVSRYARLTLDEACELALARVSASIEASAGQRGPAHRALVSMERSALQASLRRLPSPEREAALALLAEARNTAPTVRQD